MMLTGNIGKPGAGAALPWAGNYKAALFQGSPQTGGFKGWVAEDPFHPNLDPALAKIIAHALHQGRRTGLLEPFRATADCRDAQSMAARSLPARPTCPPHQSTVRHQCESAE